MTLGLKRLECVTSITHDVEHSDFVLHRAKDNTSEFHAWRTSEKGDSLSWHLPREEATFYEANVSGYWSNLEENAFDEARSVKTLRLVSWAALERDPTWKARIDSLAKVCSLIPTQAVHTETMESSNVSSNCVLMKTLRSMTSSRISLTQGAPN